MAVVACLLRGEPLELVARETNVTIQKLTEWRDRALAGAASALKERERDDRDNEIAQLKAKVRRSPWIVTISELPGSLTQLMDWLRVFSLMCRPPGSAWLSAEM
jgi:hypothetical protein